MAVDEAQLERAAARELEDAGFRVELRVPVLGESGPARARADVVGWGADDDGVLHPDVLVEVRSALSPKTLRDALPQLSRYAAALGVRRSFVFSGRWHEANRTFTELVQSQCPRPERPAKGQPVPDEILRRMLSRTMKVPVRGATRAVSDALVGEVEKIALVGEGRETLGDDRLDEVVRDPRNGLAIAWWLSEVLSGGHFMPKDLAVTMARLLRPRAEVSIVDPFPGTGALAWGLSETNRRTERSVTVTLYEADELRGRLLAALGRIARSNVSVERADVLQKGLVVGSDVLTVLPLSARLDEPFELFGGGRTRDLDVYALDLIGAALRDSGRAVVAVAPRVLFAHGAERVRRSLAGRLRVVAVVELPKGDTFFGTVVSPALLVLESGRPGETLMAQLGEDWRSQLAEGGEFYRAYVEHLELRR